MHATTIGLDLAKSVFQIHGVDAHGKVVTSKRSSRDAVLTFFANLPPCTVGMEACATAHHWARRIRELGHEVRLMPPRHVKPYVKRHKKQTPMGRAGQPAELAATYVLLASEGGSYISGALIPITGGTPLL